APTGGGSSRSIRARAPPPPRFRRRHRDARSGAARRDGGGRLGPAARLPGAARRPFWRPLGSSRPASARARGSALLPLVPKGSLPPRDSAAGCPRAAHFAPPLASRPPSLVSSWRSPLLAVASSGRLVQQPHIS